MRLFIKSLIMVQMTKYLKLDQDINFSCHTAGKKILFLICVLSVIILIMKMKYLSIEIGSEKWELDPKAFMYQPFHKHYLLRLKPQPYNVPPMEKDDYKKLVDLNDFKFAILPDKECKESNIFLLVLVISAPQNFKRRQVIRKTWGQNDIKVKTFFMLGAASNPEIQRNIENEYATYGDIVQGNFVDSYRNLTYKTVMTLKYVTYHCNNSTYILKADDDVFVNMPLLRNYLTNDISSFGAENFLHCHVMRNIPILRDKRSKWSVTEEEFPGTLYPTYCNGPYSLFSPDVFFKLYVGAQKSKFFYIEDVFLYGLAAGKYPEINHTDTRPFTLWYYYKFDITSGAFDHMNFLFGPFGLSEKQIEEFWHLVTSKPVPSSIYYHV